MKKITTNNNMLLYPEAVKRIQKDLEIALTNWDYLSGVGGEGPIAEFEREFIKTAGGHYAIALTNATSALYVALMSLGISKGDEVILPSYTWPQTLSPVILAGAIPVFADIAKDSVTISPASVEKLISNKIRAIIAVHLFGLPADVHALAGIARTAKCALIYDAAQGFGTMVDDKPIGYYGDYVAFSFGRSKLISAGEGGALICRSRRLYERAVAFSQHPLRMHRDIDGSKLRQSIDGVSMNFRLHPLVASLAIGQLQGFYNSGKLEALREIHKTLETSAIKGFLSKTSANAIPSSVCFPVLVKSDGDKKRVAEYARSIGLELYEGGVQQPLHLTPTISRHKLLSHLGQKGMEIPAHKTHKKGSCPNTEERCRVPQLFLRESGLSNRTIVANYSKRGK